MHEVIVFPVFRSVSGVLKTFSGLYQVITSLFLLKLLPNGHILTWDIHENAFQNVSNQPMPKSKVFSGFRSVSGVSMNLLSLQYVKVN